MKRPAAQGTQVPSLLVLATVPGLQGVCCALPVGAKWPLSVGVHSAALVRLVELEYEPSWQGSGALAPNGQYEPGSQATQAVCSSWSWKVPAAHLSHAPMPERGVTVPGLHGVCCVLPVEA